MKLHLVPGVVALFFLAGCAGDEVTQQVASVSPSVSEKRIALEDLRSALLTEADLPDDAWRISDTPVTIGQSDGRTWMPMECGERFTQIFSVDLAPPTQDFVTVTYEQAGADDFRVVTENISGWSKPPDLGAIAADFRNLIDDCPALTGDQVALTLTALEVDDAVAIRVTYGAAVLTFNLDIAYAVVGPYLVGVTNTGVAVTESELSGLMEIAIVKLQSALDSGSALPDGVALA